MGRRLPRLCAWVRPAAAGFTGAAAQRYHEALLGHDTTPPRAPNQQEHGAIECPRGDTTHTHTPPDRSADAMTAKHDSPGPHDRPFPAEWIDPQDSADHLWPPRPCGTGLLRRQESRAWSAGR